MLCYIFGALSVDKFNFKTTENDLIIAADSGLKSVNKFNITPDFIIGDFDSLGYEPQSYNVITYPVEKDDTDTLLAIKYAMEKGYRNFRILGCVGGRLDHTFANIQAASYIVENGGSVVFYGNDENFTVIKNTRFDFNETNCGNISVFALEPSKNVNIKGLFYEITNGELTPNFPLGVSNKFINKNAFVSVGDGKLLIIWKNNNIVNEQGV